MNLLKFRAQPANRFPLLWKMLKNGEIDLMGTTLYDESINREFAYTGHSYGSVED